MTRQPGGPIGPGWLKGRAAESGRTNGAPARRGARGERGQERWGEKDRPLSRRPRQNRRKGSGGLVPGSQWLGGQDAESPPHFRLFHPRERPERAWPVQRTCEPGRDGRREGGCFRFPLSRRPSQRGRIRMAAARPRHFLLPRSPASERAALRVHGGPDGKDRRRSQAMDDPVDRRRGRIGSIQMVAPDNRGDHFVYKKGKIKGPKPAVTQHARIERRG